MLFISILLIFLFLRLVISIKKKKKDSFIFLPLIYNSIFASFATVSSRYTVFGLNATQALAISLIIGLIITVILVFLCIKLVKRGEAIYDVKSLSVALPANILVCIVNGIVLFWALK